MRIKTLIHLTAAVLMPALLAGGIERAGRSARLKQETDRETSRAADICARMAGPAGSFTIVSERRPWRTRAESWQTVWATQCRGLSGRQLAQIIRDAATNRLMYVSGAEAQPTEAEGPHMTGAEALRAGAGWIRVLDLDSPSTAWTPASPPVRLKSGWRLAWTDGDREQVMHMDSRTAELRLAVVRSRAARDPL